MLGHGADRLYGPRMGPIDNFSLVTGSTEFSNVCKNRGRETVTVAGRCDGMSGNNSV